MLSLKFSTIKSLQYYDEIKHKIKNFDALGLAEEDIKKLIISKPAQLIKINNDFMTNYIQGYNFDELISYTKLKEANKPTDTKYHLKILGLKNVFNYKTIIGNKYYLAEILDQHTCIYCNRNYVKTVGNSDNKILRAEYDHFFNKNKYPLLALSFYNLIPICSTCNKKKGDTDFDLDNYLHPYLMSDEDKKFNFSYRKKSFIDNNVKLCISTTDSAVEKKIKKTFKDLCLNEIYNSNSDKELRDLLDLRYKYSQNYLEILLNNTFKNLPITKEEVYRMVFGIETKEEDYHKRPFSKFKKDIIDELLKK
ncbi:HNH endonuclease [Chryseobacterium taichungense]|uniref:HNH endonuclease n=1 Tax=Chryseobacterium taichungense TaxID=295069 RepID=A0A1H7Y814_9FLAO|nr:HNH endonuclease [Chryseobacterium taichungense]SEM42085.1 HNH endonuclease [Chryseobacterium taichungense]